VDPIGQGLVAGSYKYDKKHSGSGATELLVVSLLWVSELYESSVVRFSLFMRLIS
jgi:hypothetical protein